MPEQFLHGVEVLEINDGPRPIRTVRSSVIGLVGTGTAGATMPLDTPILLTSGRDAGTLVGAGSYLAKALEAIFKQAGAVVIVVRTEDVEGSASAFTGVFALKRAQADLGYTPRILIAEGAATVEVAASLKAVAASLRAVAPVGLVGVADATAATGWVEANGNERTYAIWPSVNGGEDPAPYVAGAIARSDNDRGFWWSPSNFEVFGINKLDSPVDFQLGDPTSLANILNEGNVTTFIKEGGFRLWGNHTGAVDPKWTFLCIRRTADMINDSVQREHLWAVDRGITKNYFSDVTEGVNGYLRSLENQEAILGGKCWPDPDLSSTANIPQGKTFFNFDFTGVYPAEHVTFRSMLVNDYIEELV